MKRLSFEIRFAIARFRHWRRETLPFWLAQRLPRRVALMAFVRVYAVLGRPGQDYEAAYKLWERGPCRPSR